MTMSTQPAERSRQEVADLKASWLADPCWNIEETEGFGERHSELLAFRLFHESNWRQGRDSHLRARAAVLGINVKAAQMIEALESRIAALERIIDRVDGKEWGNG